MEAPTAAAKVAHAGESVIALHARYASALDAAESTMPAAKSAFRRGEMRLRPGGDPGVSSAKGLAAKCFVAAESGRAAKSGSGSEAPRDFAIGIRHTEPMDRVMLPHIVEARMKIAKT